MSSRNVDGTIKSLINTRGLSLDCDRVLNEGMILLMLIQKSETMVWNKLERSKVCSDG